MSRAVVAGIMLIGLSISAFGADFTTFDGANGAGAIIVMLGEIKTGDEIKFKELVKSLMQEGKWVDRVYLYSGGGSMHAAMNIGEQIYLLRANTFAPVDWRKPGQPRHFMCQGMGANLQYYPDSRVGNPDCNCASACFFIWAAGRGRNGNALDIHRIKFDPTMFGKLPVSEAETLYNQEMEGAKSYLHKMGIPDSIADLAFSVGSDDIRYLTPQEYSPLVGIGTPYLEELVIARCGNYTPRVRESNQLRMQWWACYYKTREEEVRRGMADWEKAFP